MKIAHIQITDEVHGDLLYENGCLTLQRETPLARISDTLLNKKEVADLYQILREDFKKQTQFPNPGGAL